MSLTKLLSAVEKTDSCWLWRGIRRPHTRDGYGSFYLNGRGMGAHKASWILHNGPVPDGLWVLHKCDVKACVRPDHLYLGTVKENAKDAVERGRMATGDRNGMRKHPESRLFGASNPAVKAMKPFCKRGHRYTGELDGDGYKFCRPCRNLKQQERYRKSGFKISAERRAKKNAQAREAYRIAKAQGDSRG